MRRRSSRARVALAVTVLSGWSIGLAGDDRQTRADCGEPFGGFDSRLTIELLGVLPADMSPPVGFEITPSGPVIATKNRLYAFRKDSIVALPLTEEISGVAVDADGRLALQSAKGVAFVGVAGLEPVAPWARVLEGRVFNSGARPFLEAVVTGGTTRFGARMTTNERVLPIAELSGELRAASWDRHGLLAVVGNALVRWSESGNVLERIAVDSGLEATTGVCTVDGTRALVTLETAAMLFTGKAITVIAAAGGLCRTDGAHTMLFDPRLRRVWRLEGLSSIGEPAQNLEYAKRLVQLGVTQGIAYTRTKEFSEAVRLIGCSKAVDLATQFQR